VPKTTSAALRAHLDREVTSLATLWRVVRQVDGKVFAFTDHDADVEFGGVVYRARDGFARTAITQTATLSVDTMSVEGILSVGGIEEADLRAGLFDFAELFVFVVNWEDPDGQGALKLKRGNLGEVVLRGSGTYAAEVRGIHQRLAQQIVEVYSPSCRADLYDAGSGPAGGCNVDPANFTQTTEVESASGRRTIIPPANATVRPAVAAAGQTEHERILFDGSGVFSLLRDLGTGDGTPRRPFRVATAADLSAVRDDPLAHYAQVGDVDAGAFGLFSPILGFGGVYDGRGFQIQNLDLDHSASPVPAGLFASPVAGYVLRRVAVVVAAVRSDGANFKGPLLAEAAVAGLIEDCYAEGGSVTTDGDEAGGFAGSVANATIRRCYAQVPLVGTIGVSAGGFLGAASTLSETATFFDSDVAGTTQNAGAASAETTADMQQQATFDPEFDFQNDWKIDEGNDSPRHRDPGRSI